MEFGPDVLEFVLAQRKRDTAHVFPGRARSRRGGGLVEAPKEGIALSGKGSSVGYPDGVVDALLASLPELKASYEQNVESLAGPYVAFSVLLNPFLWKLLESEGGEDELRRIFGLVERLARDSDYRVRTLVAIEVLEPLVGEFIAVRALGYMGSATRVLFAECERFIARIRWDSQHRFRQLWSRLHEMLSGPKAKTRRLLFELQSAAILRPEEVAADLQPAVQQLIHAEATLTKAAECYLRREPYARQERLGPVPEVFRKADWQDEESAIAAHVLRYKWRRLQELAQVLSE
jgi:hypothetical protein